MNSLSNYILKRLETFNKQEIIIMNKSLTGNSHNSHTLSRIPKVK